MWEKKIFEKGKGKKGPIIGKGKAKERPKLLSFATLIMPHIAGKMRRKERLSYIPKLNHAYF